MRTKRALLGTISSLLNFIFSFISSFILTHAYITNYGSEAYGLYSSVTQFLGFFSLLQLGVGAAASASFYRSLANKDEEGINRIFQQADGFHRKLAFALLAYAFFLAVYLPYTVTTGYSRIQVALFVAFISVSTFSQYLLGLTNQILIEADQKVFFVNAVQIAVLTLSTVFSLIIIKAGVSFMLVILSVSALQLGRPVAFYLYTKKHYSIKKISPKPKNVIPQMWNGVAQHIAWTVLNNGSVIIITLLGNLGNVAVYTVYYTILAAIRGLISSVSSSALALLGNMIAKGEEDLLRRAFRGYEWVCHAITTLLFSIAIVVITPFVNLYTADVVDVNYNEPLFGIILAAAISLFCFRLPYANVINAAGHFRQTQLHAMTAAAVNIVASVVLFRLLGLAGVALGTLAAMAYWTAANMYYLTNNIVHLEKKQIAFQILHDLLTTFFIVLATRWFKPVYWTYMSWIWATFLASILALSISFGMNFIFYRSRVRQLANFIAKRKRIKQNE